MARVLTAPAGPDSTQRVRLDGREYVLRWRWVQRASRWALDLSSADGTLLVGGIRVAPNVPLLRDVRAGRPEMPPGELLVVDPRRSPRVPGLDGLGSDTSRIVYLTEAEVPA